MSMQSRTLCIIPARGSSKRIPGKNSKLFAGKPLIAHTIAQSKQLKFVDRIIVDTDSPDIAAIAKKYGAQVPFLRPARLAGDKAKVADSAAHLLSRLAQEEEYRPEFILLLQTTSPLRELQDIEACWKKMQKGGADAVITVCPTHPRLYYLTKKGELLLANRKVVDSSNVQAWPPAFMLNGCFVYLIKTKTFLKERVFIPKRTKAVVCPRWRSADLDTPEDWVLAEHLYKNRGKIERALKNFK